MLTQGYETGLGHMTRLTVSLAQPVSYRVVPSGTSLKVLLASSGPGIPAEHMKPATPVEASVVPSALVRDVRFERTPATVSGCAPYGCDRVAVDLGSMPAYSLSMSKGGRPRLELRSTALPETLARTLDVSAFDGALKTITALYDTTTGTAVLELERATQDRRHHLGRRRHQPGLRRAPAADRRRRAALAPTRVRPRGHAIEARVCAERPAEGFLPATGRVLVYQEPEVEGVRLDSGITAGSEISAAFDSLLLKVVAHAGDRDGAIGALDRGLAELVVLGVETNVDFLRSLLADPRVRAGETTTGDVEALPAPDRSADRERAAIAAAAVVHAQAGRRAGERGEAFSQADGWRLGGAAATVLELEPPDGAGAAGIELRATPVAGGLRVAIAGRPAHSVAVLAASGAALELCVDGGERERWAFAHDPPSPGTGGEGLWLAGPAGHHRLRARGEAPAPAPPARGALQAPLPGVVVALRAAPGDVVAQGDPLVVIESMKMELEISAPHAGVLTALSVGVGEHVARGQVLAAVAPSPIAPSSVAPSSVAPSPVAPAPGVAPGPGGRGGRTMSEREAHLELIDDLSRRLRRVAQGGGERARTRHTQRGKLLARDRVDRLVDPFSPFLELSPLAAQDVYARRGPQRGDRDGDRAGPRPRGGDHRQRRDGQGRHLLPDDGQEASARPGDRAPEPTAVHLPGGLRRRLPAAAGRGVPRPRALRPDLLQPGGDVGAGNPADRRVMGSCTAGGAYVPAMSDETVIVREQGTIFLGGPPLVRAATGEEVTAEELGGGDLHTRVSGVADHLAVDDARRAADRAPDRRPRCPTRRRAVGAAARAEPPAGGPRRPVGVVPADRSQPLRRARGDRAGSSTRSRLHEFKARYGDDARVRLRPHPRPPGRDPRQQGHPVLRERAEGRALHRAVRPARRAAALPAEHRRLHGRPRVRGAAGSPRTAPRWSPPSPAPACPKLTVIIGGSFGAGNYGMCGRAYSPRFLWMWPNARISVMGGEQAATVLSTVRAERRGRGETPAAEREALRGRLREEYERQGRRYYATARLWDDGIIDPLDTRRVVGLALDAAANAPLAPVRRPLFRM